MKISIVGAGQAGCLTALHYYLHAKNIDKITIYHDPDTPIEETGQGTNATIPELLFKTLGIDLVDNNTVKATIKTGILYEGWAHGNKMVSPFKSNSIGYHYIPKLLSEATLNSGLFNVETKKITDPESEIDGDWIFDCRGRKENNAETSDELVNPLNCALLANVPEVDPGLVYTKCVATPNGWTFVIPNSDSTSYGYLYNSNITTEEEARAGFREQFGVDNAKNLPFKNYVEKSMWEGERTILNGNRFTFLEPLEATSTESYLKIARHAWDCIFGGYSKDTVNLHAQRLIRQHEKYVLAHYHAGSVYDTPFWDHAKSLESSFLTKEYKEYVDLINGYDMREHFTQKFPNWGNFPSWSVLKWYNQISL